MPTKKWNNPIMAAAGHQNVIIRAGAGGDPEPSTQETQTIEYYEPSDDCPVCLDDFKEEKLDVVTCGCGYMVCRKCVQTYLLHTTKDPHCMKCKRAWDRDFQYNMLTPKFVNNKYKKHRKQLLFEREKAKLPEAQPYVEQYKNKGLFDDQLKELNNEISVLRQQMNTLLMKRDGILNKIRIIETGGFVKPKEKRQFIRKCPSEGCRGFLSSAYKCDLCKVHVCSKCLEIKGFTNETEHECDPENVESATAIKKETRPCPKCAVPIFKISGCDQMWCTQCQVAFSWKSGTIDQGRVHNPHFYQYMQNNDTNVRVPGEQVCGGLPGYYSISRMLRRFIRDPSHSYFVKSMALYRSLIHNQRVVIDSLRRKLNVNQDNLDLRVKYLAKDVDDKYMLRYITQRDNIRQKNTAMLHVLELLNVVMTEQINTLMTQDGGPTSGSMREKFIAKLDTMHEVAINTRAYCNKELEKISRNYNMKVYFIGDDYSVEQKMVKFT